MNDVSQKHAQTTRRITVGFGLAVLIAGVPLLALSGVDRVARRTSTEVVSYGTDDLPAGITAILVRGAGDVTVLGRPTGNDDAEQVRVKQRVVRGLRPVKVTSQVRGSTLELRGNCPALTSVCTVDFEIVLPDNVSLKLTSSGGDVTVRNQLAGLAAESSGGDVSLFDVTGAIEARSSGGSLLFERVDGPIKANTSGGKVMGVALKSSDAAFSSSGGDVNVTFVVAPQRVKATSSGGDVVVALPRGPEVYAAIAESSGGDKSIDVRTDPESPNKVEARSSGGDARIEYSAVKYSAVK
jgi:Putative adhesin